MAKFKPTSEQISLAENLLVAKAHESLVRPIVVAYETAILKRHQFRVAPHWVKEGCEDTVILDRKDAFLMSNTDSLIFYRECHKERDAARLTVPTADSCPLLVCEYHRILAENAFLEAMATTPGLEALGSGVMTLEERKEAIDLALGLVTPFVGTSDEILGRLTLVAA